MAVLSVKSMAENVVTPGEGRTCLVCRRLLPNAAMAVNSHLRKHIRAGELSKASEQEMRMRILGRTFSGTEKR